MNDGALVEALSARDPGALAALYDSYAESIYRYCWSMTGTPDGAQVALRDTLIATEARIHELADSDRLEVWLYALARGECVRHSLAAGPNPVAPPPVFTGPVAPPPVFTGGDADLRVMAWNATRSLSSEDREVLELTCRHGLAIADLAAVLRVTAKLAGTLYESARDRLRDAVTAEVLVRKGPYDCASRARILTGFSGELTAETRARVIHHVNRCDTCAPHRIRRVSASKVFGLLPVVALPKALRVRVMSCFADPELVPYRRYVARRVGILDAAGFPSGGTCGNRRRSYAMAGARFYAMAGVRSYAMAGAAVTVTVIAAVALIFTQLVGKPDEVVVDIASGVPPTVNPSGVLPTADPPDIRLPWDLGRGDTLMLLEPIRGKAFIYPIGLTGLTGPTVVTRPDSGPDSEVGSGADRRSDSHDPTGRPVEPSRRPSDGPGDPSARPAEPSPTERPASPVLPGPTRTGAPERPQPPRDHRRARPNRPQPRDHQGGRPAHRPCATGSKPKPVPTPSQHTPSDPKPLNPTPSEPSRPEPSSLSDPPTSQGRSAAASSD